MYDAFAAVAAASCCAALARYGEEIRTIRKLCGGRDLSGWALAYALFSGYHHCSTSCMRSVATTVPFSNILSAVRLKRERRDRRRRKTRGERTVGVSALSGYQPLRCCAAAALAYSGAAKLACRHHAAAAATTLLPRGVCYLRRACCGTGSAGVPALTASPGVAAGIGRQQLHILTGS